MPGDALPWALVVYPEGSPTRGDVLDRFATRAAADRAARAYVREARESRYMVDGNTRDGYSVQRRFGVPPYFVAVERRESP